MSQGSKTAGLFTRLLGASRQSAETLAQTARLMIGLPDYETYVAHMSATHPELEPMSREAFFVERQEARYGGKGRMMNRCC